ncbi:MAG: GAF domain-containing protein [Gemmatimonadetes bacterium]|nr:GAF domain-containing protein [Gemmatimonadota bacterium]
MELRDSPLDTDIEPHGDVRALLSVVADATSVADALTSICTWVEQAVPTAHCSVLLFDRASGTLNPAAAPSLPVDFVALTERFPVGPENACCGTAAHERRTVVCADITTDSRWTRWVRLTLPFGLRACWSVPMMALDGAVLGTFALYFRRPAPARDTAVRWLEDVARIAAFAIDRDRAFHDAEKSRRFVDRIVEAIPDVVFTFDLVAQRFTWVSPASELIGGYAPSELVAFGHEVMPRLVHPDDLPAFVAFQRAWASEAGRGVRTVGYRVRHRDGTWRAVEHRSLLLERDPDGRPRVALGLIRDVTEVRAVEQRLRQSERMESLGKLAGGIAHDFNNVLTVILNAVEQVAPTLQDPRLREANADALAAARRARDLITQILAFSRQQEVSRQPFALAMLVREGLRFFEAMRASTIALTAHIDERPAVVDGDIAQLQQVLLNLCGNAAYALRSVPSPQMHVSLTVYPDGDARATTLGVAHGAVARLLVQDNGEGMTDDAIARAFEPFFSTKPPGEGTGLGLAVAHGIVTSHGGALALRSTPGHGTVAEVWLPVSVESPAASRSLTPSVAALSPLPTTRARTVLVVDDEPAVARAIARAVESLGHVVSTEGDPQRALERLRRDPASVDVLLTDLTMPGMSGDVLAREARRIAPALHVVLVSGYSAGYPIDDADRDGIAAVLGKPIDRQSLAALLDSLG